MGLTMDKHASIFVAGHKGLAGSAVVRRLKEKGFTSILTRTRAELDLRNQNATKDFFEKERPQYVILAAAKVGGIGANSTYPTEFLLENLQIQTNVISEAARTKAKKLVFLGSSCIYPKDAKYPLTEDQLLTGKFEPTNEAYALAKVAGVKLCEYYFRQYGLSFVSAMPTNLYGPNDMYDFEKSHVIPAMLLKVIRAKHEKKSSVVFWGSGKPLREFLYSDDLADALVNILENYHHPALINVGSGQEVSIRELAEHICEAVEFNGAIEWDASKPDGIFRKPMDSSKIHALGWKAKTQLREGLKRVVSEAERQYLNFVDKISL